MMRKLLLCVLTILTVSSASATNYLVSPSATSSGATITHKGMSFTVGTTAFSSIKALIDASPEANSSVYVLAGTYAENVTINVAGLNFLGPNAFIDKRAQSRSSNATITGVLTVNANNTTFNGFYIKGSGKIRNTAATPESPLSGFTFIYNVVSNPTVARDANGSDAIILLGKPVSNANALADSSQKRYHKVTISHNIFSKGEEGTTDPAWITISGGYGTAMKITDNKFTEGGTAINICNSRGTYDILNNNFNKIGNNNQSESTKGDFALRLYRNALAGTTVFNIKNNDFNNCSGQQTLYPCIRFYCGNSSEGNFVTPVGCSVNINHNVFRSKTQIHADYNYVYYIDAAATNAVKHDTRFNQFDNSYYAIAKTNSVYDTTNLGYRFGDNSGLITPTKATFGTWLGATSLGAVTIIQSWDIDDNTGDIYTVQLMTGTEKSNFVSQYGDSSPLKLTRLNSSGSVISTMNAVYAGHGTQLSVGRINGTLHVFMGAKSTLASDGSDMISRAICWFPWVGGATVNCNGASTFSYNSKSYNIKYFRPSGMSGSNDYPSLDNENRLFCTRTSDSSKNYYWVYNLDDIISNADAATPLRKYTITKKTNPTSVSGDQGYNTWDHQGYCIHGDYIYMLEGVSRTNSVAVNSKPTIFFHVCNWRTGAFAYRQQVTNSTINALSNSGEPEGCKVHRDSNGHANLMFALADGVAGARKVYIYKLTPKKQTYTIPTVSATANNSSLSFTTSTLSPVSKSVKLTNTIIHGAYTFTISGDNASNFSITETNNNPWAATTTVNVTYTPTNDAGTHTGYLRCSSPLLTDIIIPLDGTYSGYAPTTPTIIANPTSASLTARVSDTDSKSISFTGANLTEGIALSLSGPNAALFSLSTNSLSASGGDVTVTYSPTAEGNHSATLTATSGSASASVDLSAVGTPLIDPDQFVLTKVVETNNNIPGTNDGRFSTGFGDYLYLADKSTTTIVRYNSNGTRSNFATVNNLGSAISSDDAGNIIVNTGFPDATSATNWVIIEPNGTQHTLTLSYPSSITAARTDAAGRALGNVMSAAGGYLCLISNGAPSAAIFKIANGAQSGAATAVPLDWTGNTTSIAQPVVTSLAQVVANPASSFMYRLRTNKNVTTKDMSPRTSADGFDVFTLGGKTFLVEPTGQSNYGDGFTIHEVGSDDVKGERVETVTDGSLKFQSLTARVSDDGTYATIYQNVSGKLISIYRYGMPPTGVESVASDATEVGHMFYNLQGVRVNNPSAGQVLIRVATLSDGSVRTSKILVK